MTGKRVTKGSFCISFLIAILKSQMAGKEHDSSSANAEMCHPLHFAEVPAENLPKYTRTILRTEKQTKNKQKQAKAYKKTESCYISY